MMSIIDKNKKALANLILKGLHNKYTSSWFDDIRPENKETDDGWKRFSRLILGDNYRLEYREWADKPHYLILWYGKSRIVSEIDLSKIIHNGVKFTWYMPIPTNRALNDYYKKRYKEPVLIPENIRKRIRSDKNELAPYKKQNVDRTGYLFAKDINLSLFIKNFHQLLDTIIDVHKKLKRDDKFTDIDSTQAWEGYKSDRTVTTGKRNAKLVKSRKILDENTCQVCGYIFKHNNKYVIECHHINPISEANVRLTSIKELVCLCPTCHRIAHLKEPPYTLIEMKTLLRGAKQK